MVRTAEIATIDVRRARRIAQFGGDLQQRIWREQGRHRALIYGSYTALTDC